MSIVLKIWLGFTLLVSGYVLTVVLTDLRTRRSEAFLRHLEVALIPCVQSAQSAQAEFRKLHAAYQDAVVFGDQSLLEPTRMMATQISGLIHSIAANMELVAPLRDAAALLEKQILRFGDEALPVYARLVRNDTAAELPHLAAALAKRSEAIADGLLRLESSLRTDLRQEIDRENARARSDRLVSEVICIVLLVATAGLIATVIVSFSARLRGIMDANLRLAAGDYGTPVDARGTDEIARLAQGFEGMRASIQSRNQHLEDFNQRLDQQVELRTSELAARNQELSAQIVERERAEQALRLVQSAVQQVDEGIVIMRAGDVPGRTPEYVNPGFFRTVALTDENGLERVLLDLFSTNPDVDLLLDCWRSACQGRVKSCETSFVRPDGSRSLIDWQIGPIRDRDGAVASVMMMSRDVTERRHEEAVRQQGLKLETVGQLAAGVAHELNTPIQFIGDNLRFLGDSYTELSGVLKAYAQLHSAVRLDGAAPDQVAAVETAAKRADLGYLADEIPRAITQSLEGVTRVTDIVRAMKEFSHPDQGEKKPGDINRAIRTTITVARNEYKYVADLQADLAPDLPPVICMIGEFSQVILNLVVNAAHAIGDVVAKTGGKGLITISTTRVGELVEIRVKDTGGGIPADAQGKLFDPFFTTKVVGKGTGQGLYIARTVVVKKHGGTITFETETGIGTTFVIRLPLVPAAVA